MNETIYKYTLTLAGEQILALPVGAQLLSVQAQEGQPCLWALVDAGGPLQEVKIVTYGTGHPVMLPSDRRKYIGTYQLANGRLVFHVFRDTKRLNAKSPGHP